MTDQEQTFEDFSESTDIRERWAAAPRIAYIHEPWIKGLDVLLFVRDEAMLDEGTAVYNSKEKVIDVRD